MYDKVLKKCNCIKSSLHTFLINLQSTGNTVLYNYCDNETPLTQMLGNLTEVPKVAPLDIHSLYVLESHEAALIEKTPLIDT